MPKKSTDEFRLEDLDGIGPAKAKKLREAGVQLPIDFVILGSLELSNLTGLSKDDAENLVEKIRIQLIERGEIPKLETGNDLLEYHKTQISIPTGSTELDQILHGGIKTQGLTEIYGPDGAGKTQTVNTLTANVLGLTGRGVVYIDCEGTFDHERIMQIARERNVAVIDDFFDNLVYRRAHDTDILEKIIRKITKDIKEHNVVLIIVDGAIGLYRSEYHRGRGELNARQNDIKPILQYLRNIADFMNIAVVITNQVMGNPDPYGKPVKPIGGYVFGHNVKYIIEIKKASKTKRGARLEKSPYNEQADAVFFLDKSGISDVDPDKPKKELVPDSVLKDI